MAADPGIAGPTIESETQVTEEQNETHEKQLKRAKNTAYRYLTIRPRSRAEVERKLLDREFPPAIVSSIIDHPTNLGYLDDEQFARQWAASRIRSRGFGRRRIEQVRYSWQPLTEDTGIHSEEIGNRVADFGTHYWMSHHPYGVPEPFTLEPTESYSMADLDEYAAILREVAREAYEEPDVVRTAPHRSTVHQTDHEPLDDPAQWAVTWRAYRRKVLGVASES